MVKFLTSPWLPRISPKGCTVSFSQRFRAIRGSVSYSRGLFRSLLVMTEKATSSKNTKTLELIVYNVSI